MISEQRIAPATALPSLGVLIDRANGLVQTIATPSMVELVLRLALAVPFWCSGILKWTGFFKLGDVAVTLFTDEFMLHLPGGLYHCPIPTTMAFMSGCGEIMFPILLLLGLGTRFAALGLLLMTIIVELTVPTAGRSTSPGPRWRWPSWLTDRGASRSIICFAGL